MEIDKIAEALCAAQAVMSGAKKGAANPFFKSKYADLASVFEAIKGPFADHGLAITQLMDITPEGRSVIRTKLMHTSGQHLDSVMYLPEIADPQKVGSAITYYRRYSLMAIAGIPAEDDDGNAAVKAVAETDPIISAEELAGVKDAIDPFPDLSEEIKRLCKVKSFNSLRKSQLKLCRKMYDDYVEKHKDM